MRLLLKILALIASTIAFIACVSMGAFLAGVQEAGAQGAGIMLVCAAVLAYGAALFVVFASKRAKGAGGRLVLVLAAFLAMVPAVAISGAALFFSGNPMASNSPYLDWGSFAAGVLLGLGALSIAALAISRPRTPSRASIALPETSLHDVEPGLPEGATYKDDPPVRKAGVQSGPAEA